MRYNYYAANAEDDLIPTITIHFKAFSFRRRCHRKVTDEVYLTKERTKQNGRNEILNTGQKLIIK